MEKPCNTCGVTKPAGSFWRQSSNRDGLFGECKDCAKRRNTHWHQENAAVRTPKIVANVNRQRRAHPMRGILASAKHRAKIAGLEFSITEIDVPVPTHCPVLGIPLLSGMGQGQRPTHARKDAAPSIDRIDNAKGYVPGNVVVVSYRANRLKSDATLAELIAVAAFYQRISDDRRREGEGSRDRSSILGPGHAPHDLPAVLGRPKEEEGSMPRRDGRAGGDPEPLPSLFLEGSLPR